MSGPQTPCTPFLRTPSSLPDTKALPKTGLVGANLGKRLVWEQVLRCRDRAEGQVETQSQQPHPWVLHPTPPTPSSCSTLSAIASSSAEDEGRALPHEGQPQGGQLCHPFPGPVTCSRQFHAHLRVWGLGSISEERLVGQWGQENLGARCHWVGSLAWAPAQCQQDLGTPGTDRCGGEEGHVTLQAN